jgi:hypothetical protein
MIQFTATIQRYDKMGEKTGWTFIEISPVLANKLKPGYRVSFRVRGTLDQHKIEKTAIIPVGNGRFILPFNQKLRKATGKKHGDKIKVVLEEDARKLTVSNDLMVCLADDPRALAHFKSLPRSHQLYFSKWIEEAKTSQTKTKRIAMAVTALGLGQGYPEMIRANKS